MRDAIIAKLATQAADFYADASKHSQYKDGLMKVSLLALPSTLQLPRCLPIIPTASLLW